MQTIRRSVERCLSQSEFDRFARLSGDDNPIHVDPEFSARTRFGRTVAHGLLLCSVLRSLVERLVPGARLAEQAVTFPAPTYANERVCFSAEIIETGAEATLIELRVVRVEDGQVTCEGQCRVLS